MLFQNQKVLNVREKATIFKQQIVWENVPNSKNMEQARVKISSYITLTWPGVRVENP